MSLKSSISLQMLVFVLSLVLICVYTAFGFRSHSGSVALHRLNNRIPLLDQSRSSSSLRANEESNDHLPDLYKIDPRDVAFENLKAKIRQKGLPEGVSIDDIRTLSQDEHLMRMLKEPKIQMMVNEAISSNTEEILKKYQKDPGKIICFCKYFDLF